MPGTYAHANASAPVLLTVASLGVVSRPRIYAASGLIFPVITAVVVASRGVVMAVKFDDGCELCDYSACAPSAGADDVAAPRACSVPTSSCVPAGGGGSTCDLSLFIAWTGTDVDGAALESRSLVFSRFGRWFHQVGVSAIASQVRAAA